MQSYYSLKITLESADAASKDKKISNESKNDQDVYAARKRAKDIFQKGFKLLQSPGEGINDLAKASGLDKKKAAALGTASVSAIYVLKSTAVSNYLNKYSYSGNSAMMNNRSNTASATTDMFSSVIGVAGGGMFGGWWGALAAALGILGEKVVGLSQQVLELNYQTSTWRDEARKTSERLGFDCTKRERYTYEY